MFYDWDLIVSSFLSQYGLRLSTRDFQTVSWDEFRSLLTGISPDTALGRVVAIRSEQNKEVIQNFNRSQKQIYDEWQKRQMKKMDDIGYEKAMEELEKKIIGFLC